MSRVFRRHANQAKELADFAYEFLGRARPSNSVVEKTVAVHADMAVCGLASLTLRGEVPEKVKTLITDGEKFSTLASFKGRCFGSRTNVEDSKAAAANAAAVAELSAQPFGPAGPCLAFPLVVGSAFQNNKLDGPTALRAMILLENIRDALHLAFPAPRPHRSALLEALAAALVYAALHGIAPSQTENALGLFLQAYDVHRPPCPSGLTLDNGLALELAVEAVKKAAVGTQSVPDPLSLLFKPPLHELSPSGDITLPTKEDDFAIMKTRFRIGSYAPEAAGPVTALIDLIFSHPVLRQSVLQDIQEINVFSSDFPTKKPNSETSLNSRAEAIESVPFVLASIFKKAREIHKKGSNYKSLEDLWANLILLPEDFNSDARSDKNIRFLMSKINFIHLDTLPPASSTKEETSASEAKKASDLDLTRFQRNSKPGTKVSICSRNKLFESKLIEIPVGFPQNTDVDLEKLLKKKMERMSSLVSTSGLAMRYIRRLYEIPTMKNMNLFHIYQNRITNYTSDQENDFDYFAD